jgi:pimeloyl-ACP methyl ester carboxylesterase
VTRWLVLRADTKVSSIPSSDGSAVAPLVSCARKGGQHDTSHCHRTTQRADLDHDARSYELIARVFNGQSEGLTRDDILDNITITWLTNTALSGARLYWEYWGKGYFNAKGVSIPVAVSVFPDELYPAPRSWAEQAYPNLIHFNTLPNGGHFAAWEQPTFLSEEIRAGFRSLRG